MTAVVGSMPKRQWLYKRSKVAERSGYNYGQEGAWTLDGEALSRAKDDAARVATILARDRIDLRDDDLLVLLPGTREPRKNQLALVEAFLACAPPRRAVLVLAGPAGWGCDVLERRLDVLCPSRGGAGTGSDTHGLAAAGEVDESDLAALFRRADVVAYPSFAEGFGLPEGGGDFGHTGDAAAAVVDDFYGAVFVEEDVVGFEVLVEGFLAVESADAGDELAGDFDDAVDGRGGMVFAPLGERGALDGLHGVVEKASRGGAADRFDEVFNNSHV